MSGAEDVLSALYDAGAQAITVIRVDAIGAIADREADRGRLLRKYREEYSSVAKLEVVCADGDVERFVQVISTHAHTGGSGDRRIFVSPVEGAINIRTSEEDEKAL